MTGDEIDSIRADFARIAEDADGFAARFYDRLFTLDPSLRALFPEDLRPQRVKLVQALALVVGSLDRLGPILDSIRALGRRHGTYSVLPHHYTTVGQALLDTLRRELGLLPDAARGAWVNAYTQLANVMIDAAAQPHGAEPIRA